MCDILRKAKFTYLVTENNLNTDKLNYRLCLLNTPYGLYTSYDTVCLHAENEANQIIVIGFCVDSHREIDHDKIPAELLKVCARGIASVLSYSKRFAGNFVIISVGTDGIYAFTDAIGQMQINYTVSSEPFFMSSHENLIAGSRYNYSAISLKIRSSSSYDNSMPYDITMYDQIKNLLPNHYLDITNRKIYRYYPSDIRESSNDEDYDKLMDESLVLLGNIVNEYRRYYEFAVSLTAGRDSRANLALTLSFCKDDTAYYTFKHRSFGSNHEDIVIPDKLSEKYKLNYRLIEDLTPSKEYIEELKKYAGDFIYPSSIEMPYTYNLYFDNKAMINGNIIEQLGRNLAFGALPAAFVSDKNYALLIRNYSFEARRLIKEHIKEIKDSGNPKKIHNLMAWELHCGRWVSQGAATYAMAGVSLLNFYNCRELLEKWVSIPFSVRKTAYINNFIMKKFDPELLSIPVNPGRKPPAKYKKFALYLFLAARVKCNYYILKRMWNK